MRVGGQARRMEGITVDLSVCKLQVQFQQKREDVFAAVRAVGHAQPMADSRMLNQ